MRSTVCAFMGLAAAAALWTAEPALAAGPSAPAPAWIVDKAQSKIGFRTSFSGMAIVGGFSKWDAQINFDPKNLAGSKVVVTVDVASVNSGDPDRDGTLPGPDWFNAAKTPRAVFTSTGFKDLGGGRFEADGVLNLRGVSKPVALPFTLAIVGAGAKMTGQVILNRSQFGVGQGQFQSAETVPYEVTVPVAVVAKRAG
jgi:polyisoprenoid-binding protein YceI